MQNYWKALIKVLKIPVSNSVSIWSLFTVISILMKKGNQSIPKVQSLKQLNAYSPIISLRLHSSRKLNFNYSL